MEEEEYGELSDDEELEGDGTPDDDGELRDDGEPEDDAAFQERLRAGGEQVMADLRRVAHGVCRLLSVLAGEVARREAEHAGRVMARTAQRLARRVLGRFTPPW